MQKAFQGFFFSATMLHGTAWSLQVFPFYPDFEATSSNPHYPSHIGSNSHPIINHQFQIPNPQGTTTIQMLVFCLGEGC